jgi:hypothetical protein
MSQIQTSNLGVNGQIGRKYDPIFCKTCQKKGKEDPLPARALFSDCEKHYRMRIARLRLTGVYVI